MALDDFKTSDGPSNSSGGSSSSSSSSKSGTRSNVSTRWYKKIDNGILKISEGGKSTVFKTKEEWLEVLELIEKEFGISEDEFEDLSREKQYKLSKVASLTVNGNDLDGEEVTRECLVCDELFVFPNNWDFEEFEGYAVCPDHTMGDVKEEYEKRQSEEENNGTRGLQDGQYQEEQQREETQGSMPGV